MLDHGKERKQQLIDDWTKAIEDAECSADKAACFADELRAEFGIDVRDLDT